MVLMLETDMVYTWRKHKHDQVSQDKVFLSAEAFSHNLIMRQWTRRGSEQVTISKMGLQTGKLAPHINCVLPAPHPEVYVSWHVDKMSRQP